MLIRGLVIALLVVHGAIAETPIESALAKPILSQGQTASEWKRFVQRRIPPLTYPASASDWDTQAATLRTAFLDKVVYNGTPPAWRDSPVNVEWLGDIDSGKGYRIRKLRYEAVPGLWIAALLYEPIGLTQKVPAVLNVNGHVGPPGKAFEEEQIRCINLAKRGMLALHPEWLSFGELGNSEFGHNRLALLDVCGISGLSVFYNAMKRGLDVLAEYPQTDTTRIAMTGLSGGGWQTILLSALDTRIALTAPNAGYSGLLSRTEYTQDIGDYEQVPSDFLLAGDFTHLTAMLAPRPALLIYNEKDNCCFESYRARPSVYDPIIPYYLLYGKGDSFAYHENIDPGTHNYDVDNRQTFYQFLDTHFGLNTPDEDLPYDGELLTPEQLVCGLPENNATFVSLALQAADALKRPAVPARGTPEYDAWRTDLQRRLAEVLRLQVVPATATEAGTAEVDGLHLVRYRIRVGEWTLPAVVMTAAGTTPSKVTLMASDTGRAAIQAKAVAAAKDGAAVVLVDPVYLGESTLHPSSAWQYGLFIAATGERLLGLQTAQLVAVSQWARALYPDTAFTCSANGPIASVATLCAVAMDPNASIPVEVDEAPSTFRDLIAQNVDPKSALPLFCFGLLTVADMDDLRATANVSNVRSFDLSVRVAFPADRGQPLGSLFEVRDAEGRVLFGAGIDDSHATYIRDNNRQLVFYHKAIDKQVSVTKLDKPYDTDHNGTRLLTDGKELIAIHNYGNPVEIKTLDANNAWQRYDAPWVQDAQSFTGLQFVNNKRLVFTANQIRYDGNIIYDSKHGGGMYYYANGRFYIFHADPQRIYVCEWTPESGGTIDADAGFMFAIEGNVFTYGTYGDTVLIATNVGNVYTHTKNEFRQIRATDGKSWQAYGMLTLYDKLVIGHYPTGSLYQYDANGLQLFSPAIPVPDAVSANAREAQTLAIYGGELYAGVWPWGELWRYDSDANAWAFVTRVFDSPEPNKDDQEPFARAMKGKADDYNYWGQRITSLTNHENALYIATFNKRGMPFKPAEHDMIDADTLAQYGRVHKLVGNTQIATSFEMKPETTFRFIYSDKQMAVYQDGKCIVEISPTAVGLEGRVPTETRLGTGIYGPTAGTVVALD